MNLMTALSVGNVRNAGERMIRRGFLMTIMNCGD